MTSTRYLCALALSASASATLACENPPLVAIPETVQDGPQKTQIRAATQTYIAGVYAYVDCIKAELEAAGDDASDSFKSLLVIRNNAAVAEVAAVVKLFEERIGSFEDTAEESGRRA